MNSLDGFGFRNEILASLPDMEIQRLRPHLQSVRMAAGHVVHEFGHLIEEVFFPESGLVSVTADTNDHGAVEVGLTGNEGFTGSAVLLNSSAVATHRSFVQVPTGGYQLRASSFRGAVEELPFLRFRCLLYIQFLMVHTAQTAACNARHELPSRLARWLLMSHDRIDGDVLPMKQEFLSYMLGVRRAGVSTAIGSLQSAGLVRTARNSLTILDRQRLEEKACSCYQTVRICKRQILGGD